MHKLSSLCRRLAALLITLSLTLTLPISSAVQPALSAASALLLDADSGTVLLEKNARSRMGMASTTKIMTALVAAERLSPDTVVVIPREAVNVEGSSVYLCEGERLTVLQLLHCVLLASANDAATAIAIAAAGSVSEFCALMNDRAASLGLTDTHFVNPHGLYHPDHYTTAYDLALIAAQALKNDIVRRIVATKRATVPQGVTQDGQTPPAMRYLYNHNKMLSLYEGAIGLKTGYTTDTGRCLVSAAERDGMTLIAVTLRAPDDWRDHRAMLDYGFAAYERALLFDVGEFTYSYPVCGGNEQYVTLVNSEPIALTLPRKRGDISLIVESCQRLEFAPIASGDRLARLVVSAEGQTAVSPLTAAHGVAKYQGKLYKNKR